MGKKISALLAILGAAALILDTKTALIGAKDGIELCITTVIPSLFPFFVLSGVITSSISEKKIPALSIFCRWMKIPDHALPLMLVGLLGGYPIGAKTAAPAYCAKLCVCTISDIRLASSIRVIRFLRIRHPESDNSIFFHKLFVTFLTSFCSIESSSFLPKCLVTPACTCAGTATKLHS